MKRVMIVGISGAGKSTLGLKLSEKLGIPAYHLDNIYHRPGWVARPEADVQRDFEAIATEESWVVDGNYRNLSFALQDRAEVIVFLDFGRIFGLRQVLRRWALHRLGIQRRHDLAQGFDEQMTWTFIKWVWNWRGGNRDRWVTQLATWGPKVKVFKNRQQVNEWVSSL